MPFPPTCLCATYDIISMTNLFIFRGLCEVADYYTADYRTPEDDTTEVEIRQISDNSWSSIW